MIAFNAANKRALAVAVVAGLAAGAVAPACAQDGDLFTGPVVEQQAPTTERTSATNDPIPDELNAEIDAAVTAGMVWLADRQDADGAFGGGRFGRNVAVTSLAAIAFMADGHTPGRGEYGDLVEKALEYVLDNATESGLIAADADNGPMYGHGFATLFLGEIYGMLGEEGTPQADRAYEALVKAVRLIERSQNDEGGWRYNPVPYDADVSVTICQIMALRAARNAGIEVDKQVIDDAVAYVRRCQNVDGGFKYQAQGGQSAWPRTAAGVASLQYAGVYEDEALDDGLAYLNRTATPGSESSNAHYWYGHYYSVQAMFLAGGDDWASWWTAISEHMLSLQLEDGNWRDRSVGDEYGTAMALIILQMPKRYLPIFQK
ncbi:MAG: prenyltransferase/squalene oxidase repeat-containing protein [Planctomycetota bacterium]